MMKSEKTIRAALTALALVAAVSLLVVPVAAAEREALPKGQQRIVIPVKGMTCEGCTSAITHAVKRIDGVVDVQVNFDKGSTSVTYEEEKVSVDKIVAAINKTGFEASRPDDSSRSH